MKRSEQREQNIQRVICVAQSLFIADGIAATPISRKNHQQRTPK